MAAYGGSYLVGKETLILLGVQYTVPVKWGPVSSLQFYNDYGYLEKLNSDFNDTAMNVTGVLVSAGSVYTYFDIAAGKDQPWLGPNWTNGLGQDAKQSAFQYEYGYYF
jgi:hypothetical protein